jgi:hypothetical protein
MKDNWTLKRIWNNFVPMAERHALKKAKTEPLVSKRVDCYDAFRLQVMIWLRQEIDRIK